MPERIHFIAGLPRSGSTLLAGILRQNPRFHAAMSSQLCPLFAAMVNTMGGEGSRFITTQQRVRVLRGLFDSFYGADMPDVVFDTNRMWCAKLPALLQVLPDAKVICTVRNVAWVMDSIEQLIRRNALQPSRLYADDAERATVYSRCEALGARHRLVGSAWTALKEAFYGAQADSLLLVDYDYLTRAPKRTTALIYEFLGEPAFEHDFSNVEYSEPEFDADLSTPGLHTVGREVRHTERQTILPPDLFERYNALSFWSDPAPSLANIIAPRPPATATPAA